MGFARAAKALSLALAVAASASASSSFSLDPKDYAAQDIITRDVAIIGGGSSGVYTAVTLGDFNKTSIIVEKLDRLGGHTQTYIDPVNNIPIDLGVQVFENLPIVKNYFARFNIPLTTLSYGSAGDGSGYVNFVTGKPVTLPTVSTSQEITDFETYGAQLEKYPGIAVGFNLTYPVPGDLLLPFGEFVAKYNLSSFMTSVVSFTEGYSPINNVSTIYVLKNFGINVLNSLETGLLTVASHDTSTLYQAATKYLGQNVLLSSTVLCMNRSSDPIKVLVNTPSGRKLIVANKLVSAIPPKLNNLGGYDLSATEKNLFSKFFNNGYYTALLNNTGVSGTESYTNADPQMEYNVPALPGLYGLESVPVANLTHAYYASPTELSDEQVKSDILATIRRVQQGVGITPPKEPLEFVAFYSHNPFNLMVSNEEIQNGFYKNLNALQGQRNTFYNGAAFTSQDSSVIWTFTNQTVLPALLKAL